MPSTCTFEFDRADPVYFSGETVSGRIHLHTTSEKSVREVYVHFMGEAKVRWEERRSRTRNNKTEYYTEHFRASEIYLNSRTKVFPEGTLPPGTHTYNFAIPLPLACPTSCNEKFGHINYEISLVLNRPLRFDNVFKHSLTVLKQMNLNFHAEALIPLKSEDIKYFCCWPCSSGPVISVLSLPFSGYAPGQAIKYTLEIDNQSHGYDLNGIELQLLQIYTFMAHYPRNKSRIHINNLAQAGQHERCLRLSKRVLQGSLIIPPVPPTMNDGGIITVKYLLKLFVKTGDCHTDSELDMPILIGTVPLLQSATNPDNTIDMPVPNAPPYITTPGTPDMPPSYDFYKPPSFEQATKIGGQFEDPEADENNRIDNFIPKYPMYSNFAAPSAPAAAEQMETGAGSPLLGAAPPYTEHSMEQQTAMPPYPTTDGIAMPMPTTTHNEGYGWRA